MFENAARGRQLSWNDDVDYKVLYGNANPAMAAVTEYLYRKANLNLNSDFARIEQEPRVSASSYALSFWNQPGRTVKGLPRIPTMRLHMLGDYTIPYSLVKGYGDLITKNDRDDMYRAAYVLQAGHCEFTAAESLAAVKIVIERIDSGKWRSTDPDDLNGYANSLGTGSPARFGSIEDWEVPKYNRTWAPD
jgi:hypothetical protein